MRFEQATSNAYLQSREPAANDQGRGTSAEPSGGRTSGRWIHMLCQGSLTRPLGRLWLTGTRQADPRISVYLLPPIQSLVISPCEATSSVGPMFAESPVRGNMQANLWNRKATVIRPCTGAINVESRLWQRDQSRLCRLNSMRKKPVRTRPGSVNGCLNRIIMRCSR